MHTVADEIEETLIKGYHCIEIQDEKGHRRKARLEIKYRRVKVLPPIGKQKKYPTHYLTVMHAQEKTKPKGQEKIVWKLITDLPINSKKEAVEKLNWYAMRWKIETFHKILKSGCKAEDSKLRTAESLTKLIAVFCILSWRIFWMTMMNRTHSTTSAKVALTHTEINLLDHLINEQGIKNKLSDYLVELVSN